MDKATEKLIENLKKQLDNKKDDYNEKFYRHVIKTVIAEKLNLKDKPLTYIEGSDKVYAIDSVETFVDYCTAFEIDN